MWLINFVECAFYHLQPRPAMDMMITSPVATDPCVWRRKELSSLARIPLFVATRSVALGPSQLLPPDQGFALLSFPWDGTENEWVSTLQSLWGGATAYQSKAYVSTSPFSVSFAFFSLFTNYDDHGELRQTTGNKGYTWVAKFHIYKLQKRKIFHIYYGSLGI